MIDDNRARARQVLDAALRDHGQVAAAEVECARSQGVDVHLVDARPNPQLLANKLSQGKTQEQLMPINTHYFIAEQDPA